ncbi:MAG: enolase C-terminal domain-like protein, partial [Acidimicrobiales bacterium]
LCSLLGRARQEVPVYGSGGFTSYDDETMVAQLERWVNALGVPRVKIKIGESWGSNPARDLHRVAVARRVVGDDVELFVDANGAYRQKQAARIGRQLSDAGVTWFEEPVSSDDHEGMRSLRAALDLDVAAGEYGYSVQYFADLIGDQAVDCVQVDVTRVGGITSWLAVAQLAAAHGLEVSGHCAPNLHAHVAIAVPNLRHVEYFHDHERIEGIYFDGTLSPEGGRLVPTDAPGHGLALKEVSAERWRAA